MESRRGFSLVETIIVVAVLLVLVGVLSVVLVRGKDRGNVARCMSNLEKIDIAMRLYAIDHDDRTPIRPAGSKVRKQAWKNALIEYGSHDDDFFCPADPHARKGYLRHGEYFEWRPISTSYTMWYTGESVSAGRGASYDVLSAMSNPGATVNLTDHKWVEPEVLHDSSGYYKQVRGPHGSNESALFWDGHVKQRPLWITRTVVAPEDLPR
jgi:prepilin-type N-terminal cleavage/methylation domain-containing protein/prepilin-type processing-associated H-X9-DG protein